VPARQLADRTSDRLGRVVNVAEEAHFALAAVFCHSDGDLQLEGIQTNKHFVLPLHGSSPMREARSRPIRRNSRSSHRGRATSAGNEHTAYSPYSLQRTPDANGALQVVGGAECGIVFGAKNGEQSIRILDSLSRAIERQGSAPVPEGWLMQVTSSSPQ
jgi:hypothetical protein